MKEENNFNPVEPVTPVTPTETPIDQAPMETPTEVVTPVEPTPVVQTAVQSVPAPTKKKSILPIIFVILVLAIGGGAAYYFLVVNKDNKAGNEETTTTTAVTEETTTAAEKKNVSLLEFKSMQEYFDYVKYSGITVGRTTVLSVDNSFYDINYDLSNRCKKDGDKVSYTIEKSKVEYECKIDPNCYEEFNCNLEYPEWIADVVVNGKYKIKKETMTTCTAWGNYTNGKYHINLLHGCGVGDSYMTVESEDNKEIFNGKYEYNFIVPSDHETRDDARDTPIIAKDDVIYFVVADKASDGATTTCRVKYINFNEDSPSVKDMNVTAPCTYSTGV